MCPSTCPVYSILGLCYGLCDVLVEIELDALSRHHNICQTRRIHKGLRIFLSLQLT